MNTSISGHRVCMTKMSCEHTLNNTNLRTSYSAQTCKSCLLSYYNKSPEKSAVDEAGDDKSTELEVDDTNVSEQPLIPNKAYNDADIRPGEVSEFLNNLSFNEHIKNRQKASWETTEEEIDETLLNDKPSSLVSLTEQRLKNIDFGRKLLRDQEKLNRLATEQVYKTTTQRLYEGANWSVFLPPRQQPPLHTLLCNTYPQRRTNWRNNKVEIFQKIPGKTSWDYVQLRDGDSQCKENNPFSFTSSSKKSFQIPNYTGNVSGFGEKDVGNKSFTPLTLVRLPQPKYQETSRQPYIPGYAGFASRDRFREVFSEEPLPRPESTARTYRTHSCYTPISPRYSHRSPISKTVTLTNPFNPFNKVMYPLNRTVGDIRV